jgi:hypothetical protein
MIGRNRTKHGGGTRRASAWVVVVGVACLAAAAPGGAPPGPAAQRPAAAQDLVSAEECGHCHQDIHRYWKASLHAQAADNPRFQDALARAREGSTTEPSCTLCHAPAAVYMRDVRWEKKTSWEGVTCDFCHSVRAVRPGTARPFALEPGRVKTGPLKDAHPTAHEAAYSDVYTSSTLCAPCHQYTNDRKFDVLTTFAEWKAAGFDTREMPCQTCHMRGVAGNIIDPKIARSASSSVNVHDMPGGHSVAELNRALLATVATERKGDAIDVTVQVVNRGAGHKVPTGSPLRAIVMVVEADNGVGIRQTATRTFGRVVVDDAGQPLSDEGSVFQRAARTVSDNRLAPGERYSERFEFSVPRTTPTRVLARFYYRYAPDVSGREPGMPFLAVSAWVDASRQ